ncbi:MAG: hypothetical protein EHM64_12825 [Ignavibacteriae bacterium]|nr:MAG: hypothetical protein EHM64_12825 [Ignavibacteriota bacterium]
MKKKQMILAVLLTVFASGFTQAQNFYPALKKYSDAELEQLDRTYASLMNCRDNNYIENALATVTMIKLDLPANDFPLIKEKIDYISTHSESPGNRYRASLAKMVFANAAMFTEEAAGHYATIGEFFNAVAQRAGIASASTK